MKEIIKIFVRFFKKEPILFLTNTAFSLLIPVQEVVLPHIYGKVLQAFNEKKNLLKPLIYIIVILSIIQLGNVLGDLHDTKLYPKLQAFIRENMLEAIFKKYETHFQDLQLGDLMSKFVNIPTQLILLLQDVKNYVFPYTISFILAICYFMYYDFVLGIGLLILVVIYLYYVLGSPKTCREKSSIKDSAQNLLNEEIDDTLRNLISIYGSEQQSYELSRIDTYEKNYCKMFEKTMKCTVVTRYFVTPITIGFIIFFVLRCNYSVKNKKLDISKFVPLSMMLLYILNAMLLLTDISRNMVFETGTISNFDDIFAYKNEDKILKDNIIENTNGIYLKNVSFAHQHSKSPIINDLSMFIPLGERLCIIGDIGSGKSTILKLLLKLNEPTKGEIYLNGVPYSNIKVNELRKHVGYVPQQPVLFNRTVIENIKYGNNISDEDVITLLQNLNLINEFAHLENGINTNVGKNGSKISGGQRQLVWCLRILLSNPDVLILDEPTASLDEKTKELMKGLFDRFMQTANRTVIMVTHDPILMKYADRTIYLRKGAFISDETNNATY